MTGRGTSLCQACSKRFKQLYPRIPISIYLTYVIYGHSWGAVSDRIANIPLKVLFPFDVLLVVFMLISFSRIDKVLSMIEFMTPKIIRRFEKNWEAVKIPLSIIMDDKGGKKFEHKSFDGVCSGTSPLKNTNTRPGNEKYKYGMFDAYMDSAIQDIRYNRSLFVRTCRSVSGGEDSDAYDDKDSVHLSLLDPLFGVFQTEDESGPHQSSLYRSRPEILNDTVYSSPKVGLEVEKPPDTNHLKHCGRQERSFSEMLIYPVTYCPIYEGLQYRRHCSLCDTATIALIFNYIVETLRNHKDADEQLRGLSLRLLDLLVKHGHQTLDKIISLGQAVFLDRRHIASHLPPTPNSVCFAIRECPQLSDLGNSNDYFSLKKNLWKNLIRCSEMLLSCLLKTYKLLQYDLFTILYEDLLCIQSYSNNANVRQSFTGEEILFMGNIFSSDMIHLLWTHMEWYLIWIIRNFTINAVIDDPIAVSILGMNTRIHSLETRRGNPGNIGTNVHIFDLVLASASMVLRSLSTQVPSNLRMSDFLKSENSPVAVRQM